MKTLPLITTLLVGSALSLPAVTFAQALAVCGRQSTGAVFADCARAAAEKYQDCNRAVRDGYRPIGRDFPAMGEHWIRIGLVFDGVIDPARPEVLNYVMVDGKPKLVGLGFAAPLLAGEQAPEIPAGRDAWHDHSRTIEDETVLPHTDPVHAHQGDGPGPRLAMLHTWLWAPNPEGVFATDNWGLAYVRLGLPVPAAGPLDAARALSLLSGGVQFFAEAFVAEPRPVPRNRATINTALEDARRKVEAIMRIRGGDELTSSELLSLAAVWTDLQRAVNGPA